MAIILLGDTDKNREGEEPEHTGQSEFTHRSRKGQEGCRDHAREDIWQDHCQERAPPASAQALSCLTQHTRIDGAQIVVDRSIDKGQRKITYAQINSGGVLTIPRPSRKNGTSPSDSDTRAGENCCKPGSSQRP